MSKIKKVKDLTLYEIYRLAYYLTQYDKASLEDKTIYERFRENMAEVAVDDFNRLCAIDLNDFYGQVLYELMFDGKINENNIDEAITIFELISENDLSEVCYRINYDWLEEMYQYSSFVGTDDELEEMVDQQLKSVGVQALDWAECYLTTRGTPGIIVVDDCYTTQFQNYDDLDDLIRNSDLEESFKTALYEWF